MQCRVCISTSKQQRFKDLKNSVVVYVDVSFYIMYHWSRSLHADCSIKISSSCTSKSSLYTNFPIACPSVSKTIAFSGWSRVEHRELISKLSSRVYCSIKRYKKNKLYIMKECTFKLYLLMYTREFYKDNLMKVVMRM